MEHALGCITLENSWYTSHRRPGFQKCRYKLPEKFWNWIGGRTLVICHITHTSAQGFLVLCWRNNSDIWIQPEQIQNGEIRAGLGQGMLSFGAESFVFQFLSFFLSLCVLLFLAFQFLVNLSLFQNCPPLFLILWLRSPVSCFNVT